MKKAVLSALAVLSLAAAFVPVRAEEAAQKTTNLRLASVAIPIAVNGRLVNYVFVSIRIDFSDRADMSKINAQEPYYRDILVKDAHKSSFGVTGDPTRVDEAKLAAVYLKDIQGMAGGAARGIAIEHQAPKRLSGF